MRGEGEAAGRSGLYTRFIRCPSCGRITSTDTGYCRHCKAPLPPPGSPWYESGYLVPPDDYDWNLFLGYGADGRKVGLRLTDLQRHLIVLGVVGSGKTTMVKRLLFEAGRRGAGFLVLDWEGEYRDMASLGARVLGAPWDKSPLRLSLFDPGHAPPSVHAAWLVSVLARLMWEEGWDLTPQMEVVLRRSVAEAVRMKAGVEGLGDLISKAAAEHPQGRLTEAALRARLSRLTEGYVSRVFEGPDTLGRVLGDKVVVDLSWASRVSPPDAWLLGSLVLNRAYFEAVRALRLEMPTRFLIVVEEAGRMMAGSPGRPRYSAIPDMMAHLRKRGVGMVLVSQSPALLDDRALKLAGNIVVFRLPNPGDARLAAGYLGSEELEEQVKALRRGECLVRTAELRSPFLVSVSPPPPPEDHGLRLLHSLISHPYLSQRERRSFLGMDSRTYRRVVEELLRQQVVEEVRVYTGRGRPVKLLQPKWMNPGIAHRYLEYHAARAVKRVLGSEPVRSARGPDLVVQVGEETICVEAETGSNVDAGKYAGFLENNRCSRVVVVCGSKKCLQRVASIASALGLLDTRIYPSSLARLPGVLRSLAREILGSSPGKAAPGEEHRSLPATS